MNVITHIRIYTMRKNISNFNNYLLNSINLTFTINKYLLNKKITVYIYICLHLVNIKLILLKL